MAKPLVTDGLWEVIEPLLPEEPPNKPKGGRNSCDPGCKYVKTNMYVSF